MKNVKIIFITLILIFFGYITISSTNNTIEKENIELVIFEEESYIDDIPFGTNILYDSIQKQKYNNVF